MTISLNRILIYHFTHNNRSRIKKTQNSISNKTNNISRIKTKPPKKSLQSLRPEPTYYCLLLEIHLRRPNPHHKPNNNRNRRQRKHHHPHPNTHHTRRPTRIIPPHSRRDQKHRQQRIPTRPMIPPHLLRFHPTTEGRPATPY